MTRKGKLMNQHLCDYGCGQVATIHFKNGKWCCSSNTAKCPVYRKNMSNFTKQRHKTNQKQFLVVTKLDDSIEQHICSYGCGKHAKFRFGNGKYCCSDSFLKCSAIIKKSSIKISEQWKAGAYENIDFHSKDPEKRKRSKETKLKISQTLAKNINIIDNRSAGKCKQYLIENDEHIEYSVQGTWELNVAKRMNEECIHWIRRTPLKYMKNGNLHYYHPDFFIPIINSYVEVKGYFSDENKKKMNAVVDFNPGVKIIFIDSFYYKMLFNGQIKSIIDIPIYTKR